jgi:probable rRNA maturation factor
MRRPATPTIAVHNRQRAVGIQSEALQDFAERALRECLKIPRRKTSALAKLPSLDVVLVSDRRMAELHRRFLGLSEPTDVITFQHGEIFISTETARKQARHFGTYLEHELRLYIAHGLLHLHGFDDRNPAAAAKMNAVQEKLMTMISIS